MVNRFHRMPTQNKDLPYGVSFRQAEVLLAKGITASVSGVPARHFWIAPAPAMAVK
jgi:hypothetical protein